MSNHWEEHVVVPTDELEILLTYLNDDALEAMVEDFLDDPIRIEGDTLKSLDYITSRKQSEEDLELSEDDMLRLLMDNYGHDLGDKRHKKDGKIRA